MASAYRKYHSQLKIEYASGRLPRAITRAIPRTTLQAWKDKEFRQFWTPYPALQTAPDAFLFQTLITENKALRAKVKALFYLVMFYKQLTALLPLKAAHVIKTTKATNLLLQYCHTHKLDKIGWRYLPFTAVQWKAWNRKKHCSNSLLGLCRKQNTQQLSVIEQNNIATGCAQQEYINWPLVSIYYQLLRNGAINCSRSTFYKYCRLMNITRERIKKSKKYTPIRATAPFKILHQDVTIFRTLNGVKHYVYVIRDNFSRAILACNVATQYNSTIAKETLENVLQKYGLWNNEGTLITDDGTENNGLLTQMLNKPGILWKKLIAQLDIVQSNSMVEAANKILKYRYLYKNTVADTAQLIEVLQKATDAYANIPNAQLHGLTPNEVLAGAIPDKHYFKKQIIIALKQRVKEKSEL